MNITQIPQRIELVFWTTVIPLMKDSPRFRRTLQDFYRFLDKLDRCLFFLQFICWGIAGLALGFFAGYLITTLR
jgi:hypothetical protein